MDDDSTDIEKYRAWSMKQEHLLHDEEWKKWQGQGTGEQDKRASQDEEMARMEEEAPGQHANSLVEAPLQPASSPEASTEGEQHSWHEEQGEKGQALKQDKQHGRGRGQRVLVKAGRPTRRRQLAGRQEEQSQAMPEPSLPPSPALRPRLCCQEPCVQACQAHRCSPHAC